MAYAIKIHLLLCLTIAGLCVETARVEFSPTSVEVEVHSENSFQINFANIEKDFNLHFEISQTNLIELEKSNYSIAANSSEPIKVNYKSIGAGHVVILGNASINSVDNSSAYIKIKAFNMHALKVLSDVVGWVYFAAWTISFYPQIYYNFRRKSVVGLNFDYLVLNIHGFTFYTIFNVGLYASPVIQEQYFARHPRGVNPIQLNDVVFGAHAMFATFITIIQTILYERGGQTVSKVCMGIISIFYTFLGISLILSLTDVIEYLDYLYYFSYVKLCITLIKYVPQAVFNYRRKSTEGWSIGNIMLDFTGGSLSIVQMFIIAYNYDDWSSIFGDPTKFGLGLFSVLFDILFLIQHYGLYRKRSLKSKRFFPPSQTQSQEDIYQSEP